MAHGYAFPPRQDFELPVAKMQLLPCPAQNLLARIAVVSMALIAKLRSRDLQKLTDVAFACWEFRPQRRTPIPGNYLFIVQRVLGKQATHEPTRQFVASLTEPHPYVEGHLEMPGS
jgi:hypothetical protein